MYDINGYNVYSAKGFSADEISLDLEFSPTRAYIYKVNKAIKTLVQENGSRNEKGWDVVVLRKRIIFGMKA